MCYEFQLAYLIKFLLLNERFGVLNQIKKKKKVKKKKEKKKKKKRKGKRGVLGC